MGTTINFGKHLLSTLCLSLVLVVIATGQPTEKPASDVSDVGFKNFVQSVNDIESKLGKSLHTKDGNKVVCVPSAQILLGLLYAGAGGKTATELEALFGVDSKQPETLANFKNFVSHLEVPEIKIANTAYVAKDLVLKKEFLEHGEKYFNITVNQADFSKKVECAANINSWVSQKTENLITELITADDITDDMKLILLNAIYFKAKWQKKFKAEDTYDGEFQVSKAKNTTVKNMFQINYFPYAEDEDYKYLQMPYKNSKLSMLIILPKDHETFEKKDISKAKINDLKFEEFRVKVKLPKFKVESTIDWTDLLRDKLPSAFGPSANLAGISDAPLRVSKMMQKAYIKVDEEGTEAAAVTAIYAIETSAYVDPDEKEFFVEQPFYYAIQASVGSENLHLFQGVVTSPNL